MRIIDAKPLPDFRLHLQFDNGECGVIDLSSLAGKGVFSVWNVPGLFHAVRVTDFGAVEWPGDRSLSGCALHANDEKAAGGCVPRARDTDVTCLKSRGFT